MKGSSRLKNRLKKTSGLLARRLLQAQLWLQVQALSSLVEQSWALARS
jgi:hypothetical protein